MIHLYLFSVRGSPRDLRVFNETISTMKLTWRAAPGNVLQYRIAFKPAEGGERKEISVKGDTTQAVLKNLQPATEYELFVSARYSSGLGEPLLGTGTTLEGKRHIGTLKPLKHSRIMFISSVCSMLCGCASYFQLNRPLRAVRLHTFGI